MSTKKKYTNKELAEAHVFPSWLSPSGKKKADSDFSQFRMQRIKSMSENERLYSRLMQLRYLMEGYANSNEYNTNYTFSYFLKEYLYSLNRKKTEFSKEINLHESQLSRLLNDTDPPNEKIAVRLEIHSNNIIPAIFWYRIYEKQKEYKLIENQEIRKAESKHVKNKVTQLL